MVNTKTMTTMAMKEMKKTILAHHWEHSIEGKEDAGALVVFMLTQTRMVVFNENRVSSQEKKMWIPNLNALIASLPPRREFESTCTRGAMHEGMSEL
jgi:hypothetical protein